MSLPKVIWVAEEVDISSGEKFLTVVPEESRPDYGSLVGSPVGEYHLARRGLLKVDVNVEWEKEK